MIGLLKGMATTFGHLLRPTFNAGYPGTPRILPQRSRSSFALALGDDGLPKCTSCGSCERTCPDRAIRVVSSKREDGPGRTLERFQIDRGLCMYCGICVETCPSAGIIQTAAFESSVVERGATILVLYDVTGQMSADGGKDSR